MAPSPGTIVWMTGLSGAGKSTLAKEVAACLRGTVASVVILDGDECRSGLCADLGFTDEDRCENIRRIAHVATLLAQQGCVVLVATISPSETSRRIAREIAPDLILVYVKALRTTCESRDVKGLYKKARRGLLANFTGVSAVFEEPTSPDIICDTDMYSVHQCTLTILGGVRYRASLLPEGAAREA